jgi:hypothetical protein
MDISQRDLLAVGFGSRLQVCPPENTFDCIDSFPPFVFANPRHTLFADSGLQGSHAQCVQTPIHGALDAWVAHSGRPICAV